MSDEPTKDEKNRMIAEWLGFRLAVASDGDQQWHHPDCRCTSKAPTDKCACVDGCYIGDDSMPPDFYTDEAASALVLEKMLAVTDISVHMMWRDDKFQFTVFQPNRKTQSGFDGGDDFKAFDRKTAIAEAALRLIESERVK